MNSSKSFAQIPCFVFLLLCLTDVVRAGELCPETVGVRGGYSATSIDIGFYQVEAFANWRLPWQWESASHWYCDTGLAASAGMLGKNHERGFVGTLGPLMRIGKRDVPVYLELGSSPTILSQDHYGASDFGSNFQFTSFAGVGVNIGKHLEVGYRFQHMSNAGIAKPNPGLNLHCVGIGFRF